MSLPASVPWRPASATSRALVTPGWRKSRVSAVPAAASNPVRVGPGASTVTVTPVPESSSRSAIESETT